MQKTQKMQKNYALSSDQKRQSDDYQIGSQRGPDHNIITTSSVHFPAPVSSTEIPIRNLSSNVLEKIVQKILKIFKN